jgi:phosphatidate cytidylyltransferase
MNNPLLTRIVSALVAIVLIISVGYFYQNWGLAVIISITLFIGCFELSRLLFATHIIGWFKSLTTCLIFITYLVTAFIPEAGSLPIALASLVFLIYLIINSHNLNDLGTLFNQAGRLFTGLLYLGLLPAYGIKLLFLPSGMRWFITLLVVVFSGDILAYFFGVSFGKHKIMPLISPKKTIEGAVGGFLGSVVAAGLSSMLFTNSNLTLFLFMGACVGPIAQMGDFFESSIKRLANLKDSGSIMPGHGGVLDRIDGVLFAAPVVYAFAAFIAF